MEPYNRNRFVRFHSFQYLFFAVALIVSWTRSFHLHYVLRSSRLWVTFPLPSLVSPWSVHSLLDHPAAQGKRRADVEAAGDRRLGGKTSERDVGSITQSRRHGTLRFGIVSFVAIHFSYFGAPSLLTFFL